MPSPYRSLPPLAALRTFEAVARQLSFTRAADELALTQSAVSHPDPRARGPSRDFAVRASASRDRIDRRRARAAGRGAGRTDTVLLASERVRSRGRVGVLTVAAPAAFATWWLVPRLGRFAALHPEIEVRIAAMDGREPDLWRDGVDIAVVKRPAPVAERIPGEMALLREIVFPVCAPSLIGGGLPLHTVRDLGRQTLIECETAEAEDVRVQLVDLARPLWAGSGAGLAAAAVQPFRVGPFGCDRRPWRRTRAVADGRCRARRGPAGAAVWEEGCGQGGKCVCADLGGTTDASFADQRIVAFRDLPWTRLAGASSRPALARDAEIRKRRACPRRLGRRKSRPSRADVDRRRRQLVVLT